MQAFSLDFRIHSEVGRVRKNNQDAAFASPNLLLVADGMGGAAAGDLASAFAATAVSATSTSWSTWRASCSAPTTSCPT